MHHNTIYGAAPWTILRCLWKFLRLRMLWASSGVSLTTVALMLLPSVGGVSASSKSASSNIMSIYLSSGVLSGVPGNHCAPCLAFALWRWGPRVAGGPEAPGGPHAAAAARTVSPALSATTSGFYSLLIYRPKSPRIITGGSEAEVSMFFLSFGGDRPPVTLAPGEAHPFPRRNEDASKLKDLRRRIRLVITRTQNNKLAGKAMKTISVSVDDETHRLARIRAA